jgi:hypothetical protein
MPGVAKAVQCRVTCDYDPSVLLLVEALLLILCKAIFQIAVEATQGSSSAVVIVVDNCSHRVACSRSSMGIDSRYLVIAHDVAPELAPVVARGSS